MDDQVATYCLVGVIVMIAVQIKLAHDSWDTPDAKIFCIIISMILGALWPLTIIGLVASIPYELCCLLIEFKRRRARRSAAEIHDSLYGRTK